MKVNYFEYRFVQMMDLLEKAKRLPTKSGCYLLKGVKEVKEVKGVKGESAVILYIGKAKNLKLRVSNYFQSSRKDIKTSKLLSRVKDFDFILTASEEEAFVLENHLIKKHIPRYNIMLKDDKTYPYIVIDEREPFPQILYRRRVPKKKSKKVYGPFVHGMNISGVLRTIVKAFKLRDCSLKEFNSRTEACLLYQLNQCSAPCVEKISEIEYRKKLKLAMGFFEGNGRKSLLVLEKKMKEFSKKESFEEAMIVRDYISTLKGFMEKSLQKNSEFFGEESSFDVIAYHERGKRIDLSIYMVRNKVLLGNKNFYFLNDEASESVENMLMTQLFQYYSDLQETVPESIFTMFQFKKNKLLKEGLKECGIKDVCKIKTHLKSLMILAKDNAKEHQNMRLKSEESIINGLQKLKDLLNLKELPDCLECFDIAIFQGSSPTAGQVVFTKGRLHREKYRFYHLEEREEGNNDYQMMKEVLKRRLKYGSLPDVFIVDGGKGQVNIFSKVLKENLLSIPVIGIVKAKSHSDFQSAHLKKSEERLVFEGEGKEERPTYFLKNNKSLLMIITQMRDEAHRVSRRLHHKKERKRVLSSWFDNIQGIGPKTRTKILKKLDIPIHELTKINEDELAHYLGIGKGIARKILNAIS